MTKRRITGSPLSKLREVLARFGLPKTIVTDNDSTFVSEMFESFCTNNGITHLTSPPYHPASNGAAENFVKTFKYSLSKMLMESCTSTLDTRLQKFLFLYRNAPHTTTNIPPAELMFNRKISIRFDQLRKNKSKTPQYSNRLISYSQNKEFHLNEKVYVREYKHPNKRGWIPAKIIESIGNYVFLCETEDGRIFKRHTDQILPLGEFFQMKNIENKPTIYPSEKLGTDTHNRPSTGTQIIVSENKTSGFTDPLPEPTRNNPKTPRKSCRSSIKPTATPSKSISAAISSPGNQQQTLSHKSPEKPRCIAVDRPRRDVKPPKRLQYE